MRKLATLCFIVILFLNGMTILGQSCDNGGCASFTNQYPTGVFSTTSSSWTTVNQFMNAGNWTLFSVTAGSTYEWSYCSSFGGSQPWNAELTLYNYNGGALLCYQNNSGLSSCPNAPYLSWTATFTGTVTLLTSVSTTANCNTNTGAPYATLVWRSIAGCTGWATNPSSEQFSASGGTNSFNVTTTVGGCTFSAVSNNSWISNISYPGGGTVQYTVAANSSSSSRNGTISIKDASQVTQATFSVSQNGLNCSYSLSPSSYSFPNASAGSNSFSVNTSSGCPWNAQVVSGSSWLSISGSSNGSGSGTVNYSVTANPSQNSRTGTINVEGNTYTVTQPGMNCSYTISPTSHTFPNANSGSNSFSVNTQSGCSWNAQVANGGSWITITGGQSGNGNGTVSYSVSANSGTATRSGSITVQGQTHTITQPGVNCSYTISPTSHAFPNGNSGSNSFSVNTQSGCSWNAQVSNGGTWITITGGQTGNGSGTVSYSVSANSGTANRSGSITVQGQTHTIIQPGVNCTNYSISPASHTFPTANSGSNSFSVSAQNACPWTAQITTGGSWISINGGQSGAGNGTVSYSVTANSGSNSRTGAIQVQGQTHTITQPGVQPSSIQVTSPNGGENWVVGSIQNITATITGTPSVKYLEYSVDGGNNWIYLWGDVDPSPSINYAWTIPSNPSTTCKIRATAIFGATIVEDESDASFSIVAPSNGIGFSLDPTLSHLYWPFANSTWQNRDGWKGAEGGPGTCRPLDGGTGGNGHGVNGHKQGDYYADDWNNVIRNDCMEDFLAPISGNIIYAFGGCAPHCSQNCNLTGAGACCGNGYGNQVVIQSDIDPNYVFKATHFYSTYVSNGSYVSAGDPLGKVGMTGYGSGSHVHCILYKNVYDLFGNGETALDRLISGRSAGKQGSLAPNNFACDFKFDAVPGGAGGGGDDPEILISGSTNLCTGDSVTLSSPIVGSSYLWNTGQTTSSITVETAGNYSLTVIDDFGFPLGTNVVTVTVDEFIAANITSLTGSFCIGDTAILSAVDVLFLDEGALGLEDYSFTWSNGATDPMIEVTQDGNYSVAVTDPFGCGATNSQINLAFQPAPSQPTIQGNQGILASSTINQGTYQWNLNGDPIPGATSQFYTVNEPGFYTVTVTNSAGCSNTSDPLFLVSNDDLLDKGSVNIYPNPSQGLIQMHATEVYTEVELRIYDPLGREVFADDYPFIGQEPTQIHLPKLPEALYLVKMTSTQGTYFQKILIQY